MPRASTAPPASVPLQARGYGKLPLTFEANVGQTDGQVRFLARGGGYTLFLTSQEAVLTLRRGEPKNRRQPRDRGWLPAPDARLRRRSGSRSGGQSAELVGDYDLGYLYFTSEERTPGAETVWCVDLTTHAKVWSRALGSITSALAYRNGRVYVGSDQGVSSPGTLYALDATSNGATIWSFPTTGGAPNDYLLADRLTDDLHFSTSNTVYSLSDTGASYSPNWSTTAIASPSAPLYATGQGLLYVGSSDGRLWQIDTAPMASEPAGALDSVVLGDGLAGVGPPTRDNATSLIYLGTVAGIIYAVQQPLP